MDKVMLAVNKNETLQQGTLQQGTVIPRFLFEDPNQLYFLYIPLAVTSGAPLFVTVHGITRNAKEHAVYFAPFAEHYGVILVAPLFPKHRFSGYQRLGYEAKGERPDHALDRIVSEAGQLTGAHTDKLFMFGYSGGGQFVHRYALVYPQRVERIVSAAAGWYTFPDPDVVYPRGVKKVPAFPDTALGPARFLRIPASIMVGEQDIKRDDKFRKSQKLDRHQGTTRLERGKNWVTAMRAAARAHHLDTPYDFQVLPGCNHSFKNCMERGGMGRLVFSFLFGSTIGLRSSCCK
jgi:pimeloyl-ACP methyl ester carboxylesterase